VVRTAYFECIGGVAGDMLLAALHDAGCPLDAYRETIDALKLTGVTIRAERVTRLGLAAMRVEVRVEPDARRRHRHLPQILSLLESARLSDDVREWAANVFRRLAEAEAAVHGTDVDKVHFHEVGADDAIVDIVCACVGLERLGVRRVVCSPVAPGSGTVHCEHGVLPVPAPATALLLRGVPLAECGEPGELTTPTGAAIVTTLAESFGVLPAMKLEAVGVGAGTREGSTRPNVMRVFVGAAAERDAAEVDSVVVLETQVDDASGQVLAHAVERLLEAGALDAFCVPITMKKGRPGCLLSVLARPQDAESLERLIFEQTGTLGVRRQVMQRRRLARHWERVQTAFGEIRVKVARGAGGIERAWPEYEDCAQAARRHGAALRNVQEAALRAWREKQDAGGPGG